MPANIDPVRSESIAKSSAQSMGALVERARVVTVNIRDYTCDVTTEFTFKNKFDIPFMVPYCNQNQGEGINFQPEVGSVCWVCTPSEEGREAFILGFTMVDEDGAYRGGRDLLNPGDVQLKTRDGNFVFLRRGGIVQIGSTPVCQRVYLPIRNIIQDFAENYELRTPGGDLTWQVARTEEDAEGHQSTTLALAFKEFADDPNEKTLGLLKLGSHGEGNDTILSLLTRDKGGGTRQTCVEINKSGEVTWKVNRLDFTIDGDLLGLVTGTTTLDLRGDVSIESLASLAVVANAVSLTAGQSKVTLGASSAAMDGLQVLLGSAEFPALRASTDMLVWIGTVTAALNVVGPVSGLSGALISPVQHISPKVKV